MSIGDAFDAFNERVTLFLLRFVGPPQVGSSRAPDDAARTDAAARAHAAGRAHDSELRGQFERVTGPDGRPYLVER